MATYWPNQASWLDPSAAELTAAAEKNGPAENPPKKNRLAENPPEKQNSAAAEFFTAHFRRRRKKRNYGV